MYYNCLLLLHVPFNVCLIDDFFNIVFKQFFFVYLAILWLLFYTISPTEQG